MRSRRTFLAALLSGAGSVGFLAPWPLRAAPGVPALSNYRKWLLAVLPQEDRQFDPTFQMLLSSAHGGPGYHTTVTSGPVHGTRSSLTYAVALLDSGEIWRLQRAKEILKTVIALQDQNADSVTHGVWPWYLEEPLSNMSPPDFNWADLCGTQLLMAWLGHRDRLGRELAASVQDSIVHAARAIQRRDVSPAETHIAIMGTFVTLAAAQEFKLTDLRTYARERLRKLYAHITQQGSLNEYNSPIFTPIAIQELSRLLRYIKDGRDTALIAPLHELAWKHLVSHFHPPTQQWAGPHSRAFETDLRRRPSTLAFLQAASGGRANFRLGETLPLNFEAAQVPLDCPVRLARLLTNLERPRQVTETFSKPDPAKAGSNQPVVGTTWLHPKFTIGSVSRGDFWAQRRPLVAYWGRPDQTTFLRVRFLKDGDDFSSALIFSAQHESNVISLVTLSTDQGDRHPTLDPLRHGEISARDLRLRIEFGGDIRDLVAKTVEENGQRLIQFMDHDVRFLLRPLGGRFDGAPVRWDEPKLNVLSHLDAVLYQGEPKSINLNALKDAYVSFALQEWPYDRKKMPAAAIEFTPMENQARAYWKIGTLSMSVTGPTKPGPSAQMNDAARVSLA